MILDTGKSSAKLHKNVQVLIDGSFNRISLNLFSQYLHDLPWQEVKSFKGLVTRSSCWLVNQGCSCTYKYGITSWKPHVFPQWIDQLARKLEVLHSRPPNSFNSCNCNRYDKSNEDLMWHSDNEPMFRAGDSCKESQRDVFISSVSFGSSREFAFRVKYGNESASVVLDDGDILSMDGHLQDSHEHTVKKAQGPGSNSIRYNLTFRTIIRHCRKCPKFS